jgi:hypothetical protein
MVIGWLRTGTEPKLNFIVNTSGTLLPQTVRKELVEKTGLYRKVHSIKNDFFRLQYVRSKRRKPFAQRHSDMFQNTLVFNLTAVRTSNLAKKDVIMYFCRIVMTCPMYRHTDKIYLNAAYPAVRTT